MFKLLKITLLFATVFFFAQASDAIDFKKVIKPEEGQPILIDADSLMLKDKEDLAIFKNNVVVKQGKMTLTADEVKVYSQKILGKKRNMIKEIEAFGNVTFDSMGKNARSDNAYYDVDKGKVTLKNNVYLEDSKNSLEGSNFVYNVRTGTSNISGSKKIVDGKAKNGRVKATLTPDENSKDINIPLTPIEQINKGLKGRD